MWFWRSLNYHCLYLHNTYSIDWMDDGRTGGLSLISRRNMYKLLFLWVLALGGTVWCGQMACSYRVVRICEWRVCDSLTKIKHSQKSPLRYHPRGRLAGLIFFCCLCVLMETAPRAFTRKLFSFSRSMAFVFLG